MRSTGVVDSASDLGHHDHLCWGYEHHREFRDEALAFVDDGLRLGNRILYTGASDTDGLRAELDGIAGLDRLIADETIRLVPILDTYEATRRHADQSRVYADITDEAVAAGYTGLRTVADATVLVLDAGDRDEFVRYEHRIDRLMAGGLPFSAMCGYDRNRLDEAALGEIGCVHPLVHDAGSTFQLHAHDGAVLRLAGDVDAWHEGAVEQAFERVFAALGDERHVAIDCSALAFSHHRGLEAIDRAARRAGIQVCLLQTSSTVDKVVHLLDLDAVRADAA